MKKFLAVALCAVGLAAFAEDSAGSEANPWEVGATDADTFNPL